MADVATKCISGNNIKNGRAVLNVDDLGNYETLDFNETQTHTGTTFTDNLETKYTEYFDDYNGSLLLE